MKLLSECDFDFIMCPNGHSWQDVFKIIIRKSTNALIKNYCLVRNDIVRASSEAKRRKLQTLVK